MNFHITDGLGVNFVACYGELMRGSADDIYVI